MTPAADRDPQMPASARSVAAAVLLRVERERAYADVTLARTLAASGLAARDRALAARLVYGTLAWQARLDWHLDLLAQRPAATLDPEVRVVLRLGLHQILFLDRVPAHAAVTTSVELAKRLAPAAAGLVNAVLRRALRERATLPLPGRTADEVRHLAVALSHPEWLVARWRARFGADELGALLAADNRAAPTVLRARIGERDRLVARLRAAGIDAEPCRFAPAAVRIAAVPPHELEGFREGGFSVQGEASQLVAHLLAPSAGMRVLDACAAPGGKTAHIAELMGDRGLVVALDPRRRGAALVRENARRLRLGIIAPVVADSRAAARLLTPPFDRILVDAPCTGLGTLRAHPEVRWSRGPDDPARLAALQRALLEGVTPLLRPGGALVYATCTLTDEENEGVVDAWLGAHPELTRERADELLPPAAAGLVDAHGALCTLPHRDDLDGFYAVRVRRTA